MLRLSIHGLFFILLSSETTILDAIHRRLRHLAVLDDRSLLLMGSIILISQMGSRQLITYYTVVCQSIVHPKFALVVLLPDGFPPEKSVNVLRLFLQHRAVLCYQ